MMEEKELISQIRELRRIKPEKKWVFLTKEKILGKGAIEIFPFFKPVYAGLFLFLILIGLFGVSQKSLPGEPLFYIKKVSEKIQTEFVSKEEKPKVDLELTNKRLEELKEIAAKNDTRKLASAIKEVKEVSAQASKSLKEVKKPEEIVETTKKIVQIKTYAQKLGVEVPLDDLSIAYKDLAEYQIKEMENSSLTEAQQEILKEAKEFFEKGDYPSAFLKAIEASQIR
jgi:hypothetical protein